MRYFIGFLAGFMSATLGFRLMFEPTVVNVILLIGINIGFPIWSWKHHQKKRSEYYDRFKNHRGGL